MFLCVARQSARLPAPPATDNLASMRLSRFWIFAPPVLLALGGLLFALM
jgi:hypothetical protein